MESENVQHRFEGMSAEDRALLENPAAKKVWDWLVNNHPEERLTLETNPHTDLGVDSMDWIYLSVEIGQRAGVELDDEVVDRVETVRELLREVSERFEASVSPLDRPEEYLTGEQKRFLEPLSPAAEVAARGMFALDRAIARGLFSLDVEGLEHLPEEGPFIITPNHVSYLDAFAVAAALPYRRLRETNWAAYAGAAYGHPVNRYVSRLAQAFPVDGDKFPVSSLAFGAAVLKRGKNLIWFPGGQRSPDGHLQEFARGTGELLDRFRLPVVPVTIHGTYEAMPPGRVLIKPTKVTVVFGEALSVDELERRGEGEGAQERILQGLRDRVAELLDRT